MKKAVLLTLAICMLATGGAMGNRPKEPGKGARACCPVWLANPVQADKCFDLAV